MSPLTRNRVCLTHVGKGHARRAGTFRFASAAITAAAFSPIMYTALTMNSPGTRGNTGASTTRRLSVP